LSECSYRGSDFASLAAQGNFAEEEQGPGGGVGGERGGAAVFLLNNICPDRDFAE
jgi:hypothetical protein